MASLKLVHECELSLENLCSKTRELCIRCYIVYFYLDVILLKMGMVIDEAKYFFFFCNFLKLAVLNITPSKLYISRCFTRFVCFQKPILLDLMYLVMSPQYRIQENGRQILEKWS